MHEVHRAVRFQQIAPGALARMGFARDQKDPQTITHAVDLDDGGIVSVRQLACCGRHGETYDVHPAVLKRHRQCQIGVGRHTRQHRFTAVYGKGDLGVSAFGRRSSTLVLDPERQFDLFADDGEARCVLDD